MNAAVFSLTRNGKPIALVALGPDERVGDEEQGAVVNELQVCGFQVDHREADTEYRLWLGNLEPVEGRGRGPAVCWDDAAYFDGARGRVWVHLASRLAGSDAAWALRARLPVYVTATKLSQQRYDTMMNQLRGLAAGLLFDLVSPMLRSLRFGPDQGGVSYRSSQVELRLLERLWRSLAHALREIAEDPVTRIERRWQIRESWGAGRFGMRTTAHLAAIGLDPRRPGAPRPFRALREHFAESTDTIEHRVIAGLLLFLEDRIEACAQNVRAHIRGIEADRTFRQRASGGEAGLYELEDMPRLQQLRTAIERADRLRRGIDQAQALPLLRDVQPRLSLPATPVFEHVHPYRRIRDEFHRYLHSSLILLEDGFDERLKSTQRMYEQWVFFQLAAALRNAGLHCVSQDALFHRSQRFRYTLDLDRGASLAFRAADGRTIVLRYEPWVLPYAAAQQRGDSLYRGTRGEAAWSPDVVLEVLGNNPNTGASEVDYAVVVDAKYTTRIQDHHWNDTRKYRDIRATQTRRQVVYQLWLAYPNAEEQVEPEDSAITWTERGPDCQRDEFIWGRLGLIPPTEEATARGRGTGWIANAETTANRFVQGLLAFLGMASPPVTVAP